LFLCFEVLLFFYYIAQGKYLYINNGSVKNIKKPLAPKQQLDVCPDISGNFSLSL
jgi:hypothetical protein